MEQPLRKIASPSPTSGAASHSTSISYNFTFPSSVDAAPPVAAAVVAPSLLRASGPVKWKGSAAAAVPAATTAPATSAHTIHIDKPVAARPSPGDFGSFSFAPSSSSTNVQAPDSRDLGGNVITPGLGRISNVAVNISKSSSEMGKTVTVSKQQPPAKSNVRKVEAGSEAENRKSFFLKLRDQNGGGVSVDSSTDVIESVKVPSFDFSFSTQSTLATSSNTVQPLGPAAVSSGFGSFNFDGGSTPSFYSSANTAAPGATRVSQNPTPKPVIAEVWHSADNDGAINSQQATAMKSPRVSERLEMQENSQSDAVSSALETELARREADEQAALEAEADAREMETVQRQLEYEIEQLKFEQEQTLLQEQQEAMMLQDPAVAALQALVQTSRRLKIYISHFEGADREYSVFEEIYVPKLCQLAGQGGLMLLMTCFSAPADVTATPASKFPSNFGDICLMEVDKADVFLALVGNQPTTPNPLGYLSQLRYFHTLALTYTPHYP